MILYHMMQVIKIDKKILQNKVSIEKKIFFFIIFNFCRRRKALRKFRVRLRVLGFKEWFLVKEDKEGRISRPFSKEFSIFRFT